MEKTMSEARLYDLENRVTELDKELSVLSTAVRELMWSATRPQGFVMSEFREHMTDTARNLSDAGDTAGATVIMRFLSGLG
jgi:uncharacterized coiled-coil protein SlyX